jgi:NADH:ubiquinone oxidoreductase subunit E
MAMTLPVREKDIQSIVKTAIQEYGAEREALIPILNNVNRAYGYIPDEAIKEVKRQIHNAGDGVFLSESQLFSIASFYHMFSTKELGRHVVRFCESAPCHVMGGRVLIQALKDQLQIQPGETSPDRKWTLISTSCLGVCGVGPVILIDDDIYGNLTPEQLPGILAKYA